MKNISEIILTLPHTSIAALTWGPKHGKPILAIHGWLDNAASFIPLAPFLEDFKVIAIDLPGHGLSSHIPQGTYFHLTDYIADIIRILDYLGWERTGLLGHSLGAGVSTIVAGIIPDRITALGLIDGIGAITMPADALPDMMRASIEEYGRLHKKHPPVYTTAEEAIAARLQASKMQRSSVELLVNRGLKETDKGLTWRTDPRLLIPPLVMPTEEQLIPFLQRISTNTCFIRPSAGWPFDEQTINQRIDLVKNITVHTIPGEHHVHMDKPDLVGPILQDYFKNQIA